MRLNGNELTYFENREDEIFVRKNGKRKAFHLGSNSSCRQHIRIHYEEYQQRCVEGGIPENDHAVPREILERRRQVKVGTAVGGQTSLDGVFPKGRSPHAFSREVVLKRVAEFVVCDDQVGFWVLDSMVWLIDDRSTAVSCLSKQGNLPKLFGGYEAISYQH